MADIADTRISGDGTPTATAERALAYALGWPGRVLTAEEAGEIVAACWDIGPRLGIDPAVAFAQACHETAVFTYPGQVKVGQRNIGGIGATNDGAAGISNPTWRRAVEVFFWHLLAWTGDTILGAGTPRYAQVRAAIREKGVATTWRSLGGRWAVQKGVPWREQATMPGNYGEGIARHLAAILALPRDTREEPSMALIPPVIDRTHQSPNRGYATGQHRPEAVVWHITEGTNSLGWLTNPASNASSNYLIARDGTIYELVPPTESAWANGAVKTPDQSNPLIARWLREGVNFNQRTISIEHEGKTSRGAGGSLTAAQVDATVALTAWLCQRFGLAPDQTHILGHYEIDSVTRPNCPGFSAAEWETWVGRVAAAVGGGAAPAPAPASAGVVTPAIDWGGVGTVVASGEWVVVRNGAGVYQRRRNDGTMGEWVRLDKGG